MACASLLRHTALLALATALLAPAQAQRLAYAKFAVSTAVTGGRSIRIVYRTLPEDARIAPDDFALDQDEAGPLTPEQARAAEGQVALAELSQNYRAHPAIWKIADRDSTVYLFGTIHILPPGFRWRSVAVDRVVAQARTLMVESVDDSGGVDALLTGNREPKGATLPPLAQRVSPDHRDKLRRFADTLPPQAAKVMDTLPTWIASVAIGYVGEVNAGEIPAPGADDWLEGQFRATHRPVVPIEDGAKVLASVDAIPEAEQRRMLDAALDAPPPERATIRAPLHAWAKGEVGAGSALTVDMRRTPALSGPLLEKRNRAWADALAARLNTPGVTLFAAGAGHFIGAGSVLDLLRAKGLKVTRVA